MSNSFTSTSKDRFSLHGYLLADLLRARTLMYGEHIAKMSSFRLWLGVLSPRFVPVLLCRLAHWFYLMKLEPIAKFFSLLNFFLFGIEIAVKCHIGKGLFFPHTFGTVIGAWTIGDNATIFQGVTLGARELDFSYLPTSRPTLCDSVTVGAGAKVLGGVVLQSNSRVGANAVVLSDIGHGLVAVGIPAKVIVKKAVTDVAS